MKLIFRQHAMVRMFARGISEAELRSALADGHPIKEYPDDTPYPSCLWLGWAGSRPLHVVFADNTADDERIIITVYEPDPGQWEDHFSRRRS